MNADAGSPGVRPASSGAAGGPHAQEELRASLAGLGFDDVRFTRVHPGAAPPLREWLAAGMHADMHWMERSADKRLDPELVLPGARSLILLGVSYWSDRFPPASAVSNPPR